MDNARIVCLPIQNAKVRKKNDLTPLLYCFLIFRYSKTDLCCVAVGVVTQGVELADAGSAVRRDVISKSFTLQIDN